MNFSDLEKMAEYANSILRKEKEDRLKIPHKYSIGDLVEYSHTGIRLFIVAQTRDCDGTAMYSLCHDKNDIIVEHKNFGNRKWSNGYDEQFLKLIKKNKNL